MFLSEMSCSLRHWAQMTENLTTPASSNLLISNILDCIALQNYITLKSHPSYKTIPYRTLHSPYLLPTRILSDLLYSVDQTLEEQLRGIAWEPLSVLSPDLCPLMLYPFGGLILFVRDEKLHSSFILHLLLFFIAVHPCFCWMLAKNALIKTPYWALHKSGEL